MKNSEKLFLLINEIDEKIIENAKPEEARPIYVKPEPRSPIKEIIALAACVAVLAAGVFMLVKFRIGGVAPIESNITETSDPSDDSSSEINDSSNNDSSDDSSYSNSDIELPVTKEDMEVRYILSGIQSEALELDGIFNLMSAHGDEYVFKISKNDGYPITDTYYLVSDDLRTEPGGLFAFPQSRAELETLMLKYFSKRAVKSYMSRYGTGSMTKNPDGTYTVQTDCEFVPQLIEIDGKVYYSAHNYTQYLDFDVSSVKYNSDIGNTTLFDFLDPFDHNQTGMLIYEGGGWKLNYYCSSGFIPEYPTEFTEQDEKLQEILEDLSPCDSINGWFNSTGEYSSASYECTFPESDDPSQIMFYAPLPKGKFDYGKAEYPRTLDELEALLMKYFAQQTVDYYMERACKVTITEGSDGIFTAATGKKITTPPRIIEIDGQLYHAVFEKSGNGTPLFETARVTSQTNDSIEFTYLRGIVGGYYDEKGIVEFERGGWRMNYYKVWFN